MNLAHIVREVKRRPKPTRWLLSRVLLRTQLCRLIVVQAHGYRVRFYPSELSADLWYNPRCRGEDVHFLRSYLRPGDVYVDVGANIGILSLAAALAVGDTGRVIAFEPHAGIFRFLRANVALNDFRNVQLHNCAVGNRVGTVGFSSEKSDDANRVLPDGAGLRVRMVTLDSTLPTAGEVSLLKIDAEGYEKFILDGAARTAERTACLFIELSPKDLELQGCTPDDVLRWLEDNALGLYRITAPSTIARVTAASLRQASQSRCRT